MNNLGHYIAGIISGLILYKLLSLIGSFLFSLDYRPLYPYLETINYWCITLTTKYIAEMGVILIIIIPLAFFINRERKRIW